MFKKVLIANRGAIACRIIRTLESLGIASVAIYHQADADSLHVRQASEAVCLGEGAVADTYLNQQRIIQIAKDTGAEAIHPGYGFLSENPEFVEACEAASIVFLGPTGEQMRSFGLKHQARALAEQAKVPLVPGTPLLDNLQDALQEAERIGYPVMLKSTAGGGGIGMQRCDDAQTLSQAFDSVVRLSENNFSHGGVFLEKFIVAARHIEVQIVGDGQGGVLALGERDCSAQRRNQKVIEETPAPNLSDALRSELHNTAVRLAKLVNYRSAGTVEFVFDQDAQQFYFLEMNTRLQVEHGVTELVFGVDIVRLMLELGCGEHQSSWQQAEQAKACGHAIQLRLYAEDPNKQFQPSAGLISHLSWPESVADGHLRIDGWIEPGLEVSPLFDPMLAKLMVHSDSRAKALSGLCELLDNSELYGLEHNLRYLRQLLTEPAVAQGEVLTSSLNHLNYRPLSVDVLSGGTQTTIQDMPGRVGYWDVGVPPSGPMDNLSFRLGNQLLGNPESSAGLEIAVSGPTLRFNSDSHIVVSGAPISAKLDGEALAMWQVIRVEAGQTLSLGQVGEQGARSYLLLAGGIDCPEYLGSRSTFTLGQFGGHAGRALLAGDVLHLNAYDAEPDCGQTLSAPVIEREWDIRVIYGPHGAPDFFTEQDISEFFAAEWEVHFNSSRTGVRLIGPKPEWARSDGGEAGLHPSNIHDNAYAVGTIDFTGDMPVILGPDGPSLGGFVCPATIIKADLWKMGQLKAGDKVRFSPVSLSDAERAERAQLKQLAQLSGDELALPASELRSPIIKSLDKAQYGEKVVYRPSGEDYLLVEYGEQILDIKLRFRAHALMLKLQEWAIPGVQELTPGIRSLQIHYDNLSLPRSQLLEVLEKAEAELGDVSSLQLPSRIVHLPLSWDDEATRLAIQKYDEVVRKDAPWCPDNIEFIRRINGLDSMEQVKQIVFDASYLVMGLGDVYLGAPVATPIDPRHRLVTTKYNPARTWTPENAVGIGGAYLCVYGMEGPGGYQFVGRTLQMWNKYQRGAAFSKPWLLRFFDQIRFYPVSGDELKQIRRDFPRGDFALKVEQTSFGLSEYQALLDSEQQSISDFKTKQQQAFEAERQRWEETGQANFVVEQDTQAPEDDQAQLSDDQFAVDSQLAGNVWKVLVESGEQVEAGQPLMILEAMKMEIEVLAPQAGVVVSIERESGAQIKAGQRLFVMEQSASEKGSDTAGASTQNAEQKECI